MHWIDRNKWRAAPNTVMKFQFLD